ncbi:MULTISPECIES: hypothetical protein [unclassified Prochlorococcus]|uniref:hypothetical protein n=1 Tax=unclassified Prochlorococcus TaxID=2627481 RepID=UPI000533BD99|nr:MULTISPECIES: hypothetical protein [unclassified Prochlorococcus]KGG28602.1 hypothetical protein EV13_1515 [Prochlorococcus sp. MIT 0702]KGG29192.1 hypothetical protein EV12_0243 [Prochlorococcus sp. MIT 0701]KGG34489.1 hypothetical protein EV14_1171 [Prochlorococcus sp. MIT 0703]
MSTQASDQQLGQRFAQLLKTRRPVELKTALNLLQDLMGADISLLPSIRLLASQPTFLGFLNTQPAEVLLPQRDALLVNAKELLAPAQITRIANFLDGYLGANNPASQSTPASDPQMPFKDKAAPEPSFPKVLSQPSEELPATLVDPFPAPSSPPSNSNQASAQRVGNKPSLPYGLLWVVLVAIAAVVALLKVPALCEPFELCSSSGSDKEQQSEEIEVENPPVNETEPPPAPRPEQQRPTADREEPLW